MFVVCFHTTQTVFAHFQFRSFGGLLSWGFAGVPLFFVLSGFIIFYIHFADINRPHRAMNYLYKRFARIYPVYWAVLLISLLPILSTIKDFNGYYLFNNITLLRASKFVMIVQPAWTLCHEILFYFVFFVLILNRVAGSTMLLAWIGLVFYQSVTGAAVLPPFSLSSLTGINYGAFTVLVRVASMPFNTLFGIGALSFAVTRLLKTHPKREIITQGAMVVGVLLFVSVCIYWLKARLDYTDWHPFSPFFGQ